MSLRAQVREEPRVLSQQHDAAPGRRDVDAVTGRGIQHPLSQPDVSVAKRDETRERTEERRLPRARGSHDGDDLAGGGVQGDVQHEARTLHDDARVERDPGHRGVSGRHARTSSSTPMAVTSSSSDSATAVPCVTPAPLKAV